MLVSMLGQLLPAISYIFLVIYAPADTYKRPLVNAKKRKIYKIITVISSSIFLILIVVLEIVMLVLHLVWGFWIQCL